MPPAVSISKSHFHCELNQSWSGGANDLTKGRTVNIAVHGTRAVKLRMVEYVKCVQPELEGFRFGQPQAFLHCHVVVVDPRTREESPAGGSRRAERRQTEERGVEVWLSIAGVMIDIERTGCVINCIDGQIVDAVRLGSQQRSVGVIVEGHRETGAVTGNSRDRPTLRPAVVSAKETAQKGVGSYS